MNFVAAFVKRSNPIGIGGVVVTDKVNGTFDTNEIITLSDCTVTEATTKRLYRPYLVRQYRRELDTPTAIQVGASLTPHPTALGWYIGESAGPAGLTITGASGATYSGSVAVSAPVVTRKLNAWTSGFGAACATEIDPRLTAAGAFDASKLLMYSTQDHDTPSYVRNSALWAAGIDFTGCSPWNSVDTYHRAGTLVSPRHFIHAAHYAIPAGATIRFVAADGAVVTRTVVGSAAVSGTDIQVGTLDSDVPATIKWYKVLPANWTSFTPNVQLGIPGLMLDQEEKVLTCSLKNGGSGITYGPLTALEAPWTETLIVGDSGNPAFLVPGGELVLVTTHLHPAGGPDISQHIPQINAIMAAGGYSLTTYEYQV